MASVEYPTSFTFHEESVGTDLVIPDSIIYVSALLFHSVLVCVFV